MKCRVQGFIRFAGNGDDMGVCVKDCPLFELDVPGMTGYYTFHMLL